MAADDGRDDPRSADKPARPNVTHIGQRKANGNGAGHGDDMPRNLLHFRHISELPVRPPDWLVRGVMESDSVGVVFGESGTGKSFLCLDLACCIACGIPWHGHDVKAGPVLYLPGEGQAGIARRRRAWEIHNGRRIDESVPLHVSTVPTMLTDEVAQTWLRNEVQRFADEHGMPRAIFLDTLNRHFGPGDENSTKDMSAALHACEMLRLMTGAAVVLPHHSGHAEKGRARGSYVLHAGVDFEYMLAKNPDDAIACTAIKAKDGAVPLPMAFRLQQVTLDVHGSDGDAVTSAVLVSTEYHAPAQRTTAGSGALQKRALEILCDRYANNRANVAASGRDPNTARVEVADWKLLCRDADPRIDRRRFPEVQRSLQLAGLIRIEGVHVMPVSETSETCPKSDRSDSRTYQ